MEIKRTQPGQTNRAQPGDADGPEKTPAPLDAGASVGSGPVGLDAIRSDFRRADLGTARWNAILARSIDALLDSTAGRVGGLPAGVREKVAAMLAADPLFAKRVMSYWERNLG